TQHFLEQQPDVGKTLSLVDFIKRMNKAMHGDAPAFDAIPDSRDLISQYLLLYSMSGEPGDFDRLFDTNVKGVLFTVQKALPLLNDGGSIIVTGAVTGSKGTPTSGVYGATKAAVRCLVRVWTNELKDRRIRSNVVSPGPIETRIMQENVSADILAKLVATTPMGRLGRPEEVAKALLFLASDDSSFVTGIELFVDGGRAQV